MKDWRVATSQGTVLSEGAVEARQSPGDTAATKITIDASSGCERLEQRVIRFAPGRSRPRSLNGRQEVLYVATGSGTVHVEGEAHALEPDTGVFVAPGEAYEIENPGPGELLVVSVVAPESSGVASGERRVVVRFREQPVLTAGTDREFRYLINQDAGCYDVTQFLGIIPPSRAPLHSHVYDEVVYVVEGEGVLHLGEEHTPIRTGSCFHLPPGVVHCVENSGTGPMRVLGVFHPSGDPASRVYDESNK